MATDAITIGSADLPADSSGKRYTLYGPHVLVTCGPMLNGDVSATIALAEYSVAKTFAAVGTFGAAGTIIVEGSNDGTNWFPCHQTPGGTATSLTAAGMQMVAESPVYLRFHVTGGDGTTSLTATMVLVRNHL